MVFRSKRLRTFAVAGVLAATVAGGTAITAVNAQQSTPTPSATAGTQQRQQQADAWLTRLAQNLGVTTDRLRSALQQTALQEVDAALQRGDITAEQAQQARERINSGDVMRFGFRGPGGHDGPGGRGGPGFGISHDDLVQFLGITAEQLRTEHEGKSLAQVAQAHGKSREQLITFLVTKAQEQIAAAVQAGRLTQQQATERQANLRAHIEEMVDRVHQPGQRMRPPAGAMP